MGSVHAGDVADVGPRDCPFARVLAAVVCLYGAGCARFARGCRAVPGTPREAAIPMPVGADPPADPPGAARHAAV